MKTVNGKPGGYLAEQPLPRSTVAAGVMIGTAALLAVMFLLVAIMDSSSMKVAKDAVPQPPVSTATTHVEAAELVDSSPSTPISASIVGLADRLEDPFLGPSMADLRWVKTEIDPQAMARAKWIRMVPGLLAYREQRLSAMADISGDVEQALQSLYAATNFEPFIYEAYTLESGIRTIANADGQRRWLLSKFDEHVLSTDGIREVLTQFGESLHIRLTEIDDRSLVDLQIDAPLDSRSIKRPEIDWTLIEQSTSGLADELKERAFEIVDQRITSLAAGAAAGNIMEMAARQELAYDDEGNHSMLGELESIVWGAVVGTATSAAVDYFSDMKPKLRATLQSGVDGVYGLLLSADPQEARWRECYASIVLLHEEAFIESVITALEVDRDWAIARLNQR